MKLIILVFIVLSAQAQAQTAGARITALATAGVALGDCWSAGQNAAGLSKIKAISAAINYEQRFFNEDISIKSAAFIFPQPDYILAVTFNRYGITEYNEQHTTIAFAKQWDGLSIGLSFNYHQLRISNYGSADAMTADIGFQYEISDAVVLGAHLGNPSNSGYSREVNALVPVLMDFGAAFRLSDKVLLTSEIQKALKSTVVIRAGTEYSIEKWLDLRFGISSNPLREYFGFGIRHQKFRFDAATCRQDNLGFVPQVGLSYEF